MKITIETIKQIAREELAKLLKEGKRYTNFFSPDSAAIYYVDEETDGDDNPLEDVEKAKSQLKRVPEQAVQFGTPEYKKMKKYYESQGYEFDSRGMTEKVKPPNGTEFVDFIFRYVEAKGA
jgi:hypothetical protein